MKVINSEYFSSGGGFENCWGSLEDGTFFLGDLTFKDFVIVNINPKYECSDCDECWYPEWQEAHLVRYPKPSEAKEIAKQVKKYGIQCN